MSDAIEYILRTVAEALFCKPATFETKDIFKHINKKEYEDHIDKVTQFVLKEMFCENTGTHFLDSGGAYGREWQRAQAVKDQDWMKQKHAIAVVDHYSAKYDFYVLKNSYLFLCEQLDYDLEMDQRFHNWCNSDKNYEIVYHRKCSVPIFNAYNDYAKPETILKTDVVHFNPKREGYYECMTRWKDYISQYIDDFVDLKGCNTYGEGDTCLDKTLQWEMFRINNGEYEGTYIILQIHNGCDVRGGYSTPHIFRFDEDSFWSQLSDLIGRCPNFNIRRKQDKIPGVQKDLNGKKVKDPVVDLTHVDCYSDDAGRNWYANSGEDIDNGTEFITDENGEHHIVCKKCGAEIKFW